MCAQPFRVSARRLLLLRREGMATSSGRLFADSAPEGREAKSARTGKGPASSAGDEDGMGVNRYGKTREEMDDLTIRMAQVVSLHDVAVRELRTVFRRVKMPLTNRYAERLDAVGKEWASRMKLGGDQRPKDSKHVRLAANLLEAMYGNAEDLPEGLKKRLEELFKGKESTGGVIEGAVNVMKWRTFKEGKDGILEFRMAPEMADVEAMIVRVLVQGGGTEVTGTDVKGPQVREMEEAIKDTWRRK